MKKQIKFILFLIIGLILIMGVILTTSKTNKTNTDLAETGKVSFVYGDSNISEELSEKDFKMIKKIFDNKELHKDNPSCGFSENIAVILDESEIFCVANDECPIIYYQNENLYFTLSDQDNELLRNILTQYGMHFPCV